MYRALYRKWRPQTFDEVIGQKHITETLKSQVITGRLSHAYIFVGVRGTGKTTCARILAKAVNCEHPVNGSPCGKCAACRGIADGSVMDVVELDAASNNGVDSVRALREEAVFSPADVKKRVYIIDEVHMLSTSAFNALLKILEEPPEHLMFILATTELQKVPATILSRCQRHIFHRIDTPVIADYLMDIAKRENIQLTPDAAELTARLADGGVRDALSLLDQCSAYEKIDTQAVYASMGLAGNLRICQMLRLMLQHKTPEVLKEFSGMWMDGKDPVSLLNELSTLLRDILMVQVAPGAALELISGAYDAESLRGFAKEMTKAEIICALDKVQDSMRGLRDTKNPRTAVELCLVSLCDFSLIEDIEAMRARISILEKRLDEGNFTPSRMAGADYESTPVEQMPPGRVTDFAPEPAETGKARAAAYSVQEPQTQPEITQLPAEEEKQSLEERAHLVETVPVLDEPEKYNSPERDWDYSPEDEPDCSAFNGNQREFAPVEREDIEEQFENQDSPGEELWEAVCEKIKGLPMDIKLNLSDKHKVRGRAKGNILQIDVIPGFFFDRFKRQDVLSLFKKKASELAGREMQVKLAELKEDGHASRSLDELKQYKEVRFI